MKQKLQFFSVVYNLSKYYLIILMILGIYNRYKPSTTLRCMTNIPAYWLIFKGDELLINPYDNLKLPFSDSLKEFSIQPIKKHYLGTLSDHPCYAVEVVDDMLAPAGMFFKDLKSSFRILDEDIYLLAGRAIQIINWDKDHQFCGRCGFPTVTADHEMAKICPECHFMNFPRLSPAIITAIVKENKLLMAKHSYGLARYSLIAGFVEPGETLEEAVARETVEEVGIKVKNIRYFGSQPWPFPHSLMIGFIAEYESGEIKVDGKEIEDAKWFSVDEITPLPSKLSISGDLIEWFIFNYSLKK